MYLTYIDPIRADTRRGFPLHEAIPDRIKPPPPLSSHHLNYIHLFLYHISSFLLLILSSISIKPRSLFIVGSHHHQAILHPKPTNHLPPATPHHAPNRRCLPPPSLQHSTSSIRPSQNHNQHPPPNHLPLRPPPRFRHKGPRSTRMATTQRSPQTPRPKKTRRSFQTGSTKGRVRLGTCPPSGSDPKRRNHGILLSLRLLRRKLKPDYDFRSKLQ